MQVSVVVVTYNHEPFIAQALDSVLSQELEGGYEVIVSEDCSTDGTRLVLAEYQARHPDTIRLLFSPRNLNTNEVVSRGIRAATGTYVALLDGDDYWSSPSKLAKQVRRFEQQPELSMAFHNVLVAYDDGSREPHPFHMETPNERISARMPAPVSTLDDLVGGNFIQTCSAMFRRDRLRELPDWYEGAALGDWPLYVLLAEQGPIAYIDEVLSVYRVHAGGLWSENMSRIRDIEDVASIVRIYEVLDRHLEHRYAERIHASIEAFCLDAADTLTREGRLELADEVRRLAGRP
jgi:glycosyltransferase involved in cell wall biosynthesis